MDRRRQNGLALIGKRFDGSIRGVNEAVNFVQTVTANVIEVDVQRKRISLSLKKNHEKPGRQGQQQKYVEKPRQEPQQDLNAFKKVSSRNRT